MTKALDTEKIQLLRTLYILTYNDPRPFSELACEYFSLTGEILEGVPAESLEFHKISRESFFNELP